MDRADRPTFAFAFALALACSAAVALSIGPTLLARAAGKGGESKAIAEYCRRVRQTNPLDTAALFDLALWCRERGLAEAARGHLETVIALDPDHARAREALGYVRYGPAWVRRGEEGAGSRRLLEPAPPTSSTPGGARDPAGPRAGASARGEGPATAAGGSETAAGAATPGPGSETSSHSEESASASGASARRVESPALVAKRAWAVEVAKAFRTEFVDVEAKEFLIHTTYPSAREPNVRQFIAHLMKLRKTVTTLLGARSADCLWPEKLQFVLLRSRPEYERFADVIDKVKDAVDPSGAYSASRGHTVLYKPTALAVARRLGDTALGNCKGAKRWIAWWLREGVGELIAATSPEGQRLGIFKRNTLAASKRIEADGENLTIYTLLESPSHGPRGASDQRALAMTLVEFLYTKSRRGFRALVAALEGEGAPTPPESESGDEFKSFYLAYLAHQQDSLESAFRTRLPRLETAWKSSVLKRAEALQPPKPEPPRGRRRR